MTEEQIKERIALAETERNAFKIQAEKDLAYLEGKIAALRSLLEPVITEGQDDLGLSDQP